MHRSHKITSLFHGSSDSGIGRVTTLARLEDSKGTPGESFRTLGSFALVYVYDGAGVYRDQHQVLKIKSGDLILITPDLVHAYQPEEGVRWNELFLLFEGAVFDLWQDRGLFDPTRPVINLQPIQRWETRFAEICTLDSEPLKQICRLQSFLADAFSLDAYPDKSNPAQQWVVQANHLLQKNLMASDSVQRTAQAMGISYEGFRKKYRRLAGMSPGQTCSEQIIAAAAKRMVETDQPIRVIAEELGFCDEFHFSRRFKQITGVSPTIYRQRMP